MNGIEKNLHELIKMLVQYKVTIEKSTSARQGCQIGERKSDETSSTASSTSSDPIKLLGGSKGKRKIVLERSRKLCKDKEVPKFGDGMAVAAEAVGKNGSSHLLGILHNGLYIGQQHDLIMTAQNKHKMENQENALTSYARLGHISQDRIKRLVDEKSLDIDDLDHLPAYESCLKGMMTKKPFVGQSNLASGVFDLIHLDICGPLNTQARGGFSYFITFTYDHSRYGYVYLMRYKSEAFGRFKEFRLEVENQTGRKIKTLQLD
ncbi:UNVERIFIED_CONTAM: hypothetical protein Sindi_1837100 [Sesamum indicum]